MEEQFSKLEEDLRAQIERSQLELKETMLKAQQDMLEQLTQMLGLKPSDDAKGKGTVENPLQTGIKPAYSPIVIGSAPVPKKGATLVSEPEHRSRIRYLERLKVMRMLVKMCLIWMNSRNSVK